MVVLSGIQTCFYFGTEVTKTLKAFSTQDASKWHDRKQQVCLKDGANSTKNGDEAEELIFAHFIVWKRQALGMQSMIFHGPQSLPRADLLWSWNRRH